MQGTVIIGLVQMAVENDPEAMLKKAQEKVVQAAEAGANIICLPELFKTRYFPQHIGVDTAESAETVPGASTNTFSGIARAHNVVIIVPLYEKTPDGRFYNSAIVIDADGTLHPPYHKVHIPQDPGFFEKGYLYPVRANRGPDLF
jgi:agmatine deiminase